MIRPLGAPHSNRHRSTNVPLVDVLQALRHAGIVHGDWTTFLADPRVAPDDFLRDRNDAPAQDRDAP